MSRTAKLKEERPDLYEDESIRLFAEQADKYHDLKALYDTPGGKELVAILENEIQGRVARMSGDYSNLSHQQFIALASGIDACRAIINLLKTAESNLKAAEAELQSEMGEE